jgi:predicted MPP superfamily phosphohydrolase
MGIAFLVYGSLHLYAFAKVWMAYPHSLALGLALAFAALILTFSPSLVWYLERRSRHTLTVAASWVSYTWMGYLFLFVCVGLLLDLGHGLSTLLNFNWPLDDSTTLQIVSLLALALLSYGFFEAWHIRVEEVNIETPKLSSGHVTLAQISDVHLGIMRGTRFLDRIIAKLREIKPDIVVATGDIVDGRGEDIAPLAEHFQSYVPPLGAFAVTGNHEYYAGLENSLRFLRNAGFSVLRGESARAGAIVLVGIDDAVSGRSEQQEMLATREVVASGSGNNFLVLLKHRPVVNPQTPFDLQLSGHVHGGQIFPFVYLTRLAYDIQTGLTELAPGKRLYVSRGTGTWGPPIRLFARPEITLIKIASARAT